MFVIDVQKLFSLGIICNILIILFVISSNATGSEHGSINTPKVFDSIKDEHVNQTKKSSEDNQSATKNGGFVSPAPATDSEVLDLNKPTHHLKSTLAVPAVTKAPKENSKIDDYIDNLSEAESKIKVNGRFNPTTGAIAAATCLSLAVVGYLGIVLWRNVIQNYENREILLNEDDIGDINDEDMRHFEAACIEIDA
ncbi:uncharacterized protein [Halyomorpha halys]|uniref:uncharacterized protein isoform X2 n=1 Tax=Halyomorpha halys TaxID=286706 RepID=UPI0034D1885F